MPPCGALFGLSRGHGFGAITRNPVVPSRVSLTRTFSPAGGGGSYYPSNDGSGNTHGTPGPQPPGAWWGGGRLCRAPPSIIISASSWGLRHWRSVCWRPPLRADPLTWPRPAVQGHQRPGSGKQSDRQRQSLGEQHSTHQGLFVGG